MHRIFLSVVVAGTAGLLATAADPSLSSASPSHMSNVNLVDAKLFQTATAARRYCGSDQVVWADVQRGVYYTRDMSEYGHGDFEYACRRDMDAKGYPVAKSARKGVPSEGSTAPGVHRP